MQPSSLLKSSDEICRKQTANRRPRARPLATMSSWSFSNEHRWRRPGSLIKPKAESIDPRQAVNSRVVKKESTKKPYVPNKVTATQTLRQ